MRTCNFVVGDAKHDGIVRKIIQICVWIESNEGWYFLLHKTDTDFTGQVAQSKLSELRRLLCELFDGWPSNDFLINLREWEYPLDAYIEMAEAVRSIEEQRGLSKDALWSRLCIPTAESSDEELSALGSGGQEDTPVVVAPSVVSLALRDELDNIEWVSA